jgi:hypothetical protein
MGKPIYRELACKHKTYRLKRPNPSEVLLENTTVIAEATGFDPTLEQDCLHYHSLIEKVEEEWCHERSHFMMHKQVVLSIYRWKCVERSCERSSCSHGVQDLKFFHLNKRLCRHIV